MQTKTLKLLEEHTGINLCDFELGNIFLAMTPKTQAIKEKIDKYGFIKI